MRPKSDAAQGAAAVDDTSRLRSLSKADSDPKILARLSEISKATQKIAKSKLPAWTLFWTILIGALTILVIIYFSSPAAHTFVTNAYDTMANHFHRQQHKLTQKSVGPKVRATPEARYIPEAQVQKNLNNAPAIDKQCFSQYQDEQYATASKTCEQAARGHDFNSLALKASGDIAGSHLEQFLAATLRMEAAWSNYVENKDDLAYDQVNFAIDVFSRIASSKIDPRDLVVEAKSSLQDAKKQLSVMKANP